METITFDKLLLKTAFCCMASDGNIDNREVELKKKCVKIKIYFKIKILKKNSYLNLVIQNTYQKNYFM